MKSTNFSLSALASLSLVMADGWLNNTETVHPYCETTYYPEDTTETVYPYSETTYYPEDTTETVQPYSETTYYPEDTTETVHPYSETTYYPEDTTETIPPITTYYTHTGYTTYCPESTVLTITVCEHHKCAPHVYTVPESSTLTITEDCIIPTTYEYNHVPETSAEPDFTVTGYTTYLPEPTVVTISTCSDDKCAPHEYTVSKPTTLTVNEAVIPNTVGPVASSAAPSKTLAAVSTYEAGAGKAAAGFAGLVGMALLV